MLGLANRMSLSLGGANNGVAVFGETSFITTWNTENLGGTGSLTKVILLPMSAGLEVDWGDGTVDNLNTHTYSVGGIKTVKIYGDVTGFRFSNGGDKLKLTNVSNVGGLVIDANSTFYGCSNMTWTATTAPVITTTNLANTFFFCSLFDADISNWDFSSVTNLSSFLRAASSFNQDVSTWDISSATNLLGMFLSASSFNQDLSSWDLSSVTNATLMLSGSGFNQTNYDLLLVSLDAQTLQSGVTFDAGSAKYGAGAPATARASLVGAPDLWTITDGGPA